MGQSETQEFHVVMRSATFQNWESHRKSFSETMLLVKVYLEPETSFSGFCLNEQEMETILL